VSAHRVHAPASAPAHTPGKDLVRVCRVVREGDKHLVAEYTIRLLLEGDIETSYTEADNTCVVATDTSESGTVQRGVLFSRGSSRGGRGRTISAGWLDDEAAKGRGRAM
jgi:urate oxidase